MPLTLDKLFGKTADSFLTWDDEVVHLVWAPRRYTGEMDELFQHLAQEDAEHDEEIAELLAANDANGAAKVEAAKGRASARLARESLAELLVSWDLMGSDNKPYPTDLASLKKLPDGFVTNAFVALGEDNQVDPTKAPSSDDGLETPSSAPDPAGTSSSEEPTTSESPRGKSNLELVESGTTRSGSNGL